MSKPASIRFHAELNDFLKPGAHEKKSAYDVKKTRSIKDLIESVGVPHTEIDIIVVNGVSVNFSHQIHGGEAIEVYPASVPTHMEDAIHNAPPPLAEPRFVLDVHLGRLAGYLRMLGFDASYRNSYSDPELLDISVKELRILLTCDRRLLMRKQINYGYFVRSRAPKQQVLEILRHYHLKPVQSGRRCINCNGIILPVAKEAIESRLLPLTRKYYDEFYQCQNCHRIYWEGSHYSKMERLVEEILHAL